MKLSRLNKTGIKWKLFMYLSFFAAATLLLLWFFQVVFLESFYKSIKISDLKTSANSIAENINSSDLQTLVTKVAKSSDANIIITDIDGNILYSASVMPDNLISHMSSQDLQDYIKSAQSGGGSYLQLQNNNAEGAALGRKPPDKFEVQRPSPPREKADTLIYSKIVEKKDGSKLVTIVNATITPVDATVHTIRVQLIYVTVIMLVFALVLALFMSRKISKPIIKINTSAKQLAKGNYDIVFDENGYREIAELGNTLNFATKELSKTENLRRELIANISHDLRTPLTMITGYAEVMHDIPGETTQENIQIIIDESKRLTTLVNDMLDISKLQSGAVELKPVVFNLTESIKDILKRYSKFIEQEGYTIKFLNDGNVSVRADELRISQVIYNLVNNAITYTGKDKSVIVHQKSGNGKVTIEVIDTGEGIPEDQLPLIWDRYYKIGKKHKRAAIGTGLGLSIVKTILEQHHAEYGVQSTVGQGSVFWFELKTE